MRTVVLASLLGLAACSHSEGRPHAAEDVPRPPPVQENAIPRDLPPATPPIPPTLSSGQAPQPDGGARVLEVNPPPPVNPNQVPNPPPPNPVPP